MRIKKVLLVSPPWYRIFGEVGSPQTPLGLCYLAGVLEKHGYEVSVYNADFKSGTGLLSEVNMIARHEDYMAVLRDIRHPLWKEIGGVIFQHSPDLVGISVTTPKYGSALNVSQLAKRLNPDIPVVWGGVHPTILPEEVAKNQDVDIVVRGEGEYTLLEVIQNIEQLDNVRGITFKKDGKIIHNQNRPLIENLDELPFPARHLLLEKERYYPDVFGNIFASRGCPYSCTFCASHKIWTKKVRYRSPQNVIAEIKEIQKTFKTHYFRFEDDSFTINKKLVADFCDLLMKENLKIRWECETRADMVTPDLIEKMKSAGCEIVTIGVESGDDETLKRIKKGITIQQIIEAKRILKKSGMKFSAFFMIGFPWETRKEINKTLSVARELDPYVAVFSVATPYPGTELYESCRSEGIIPHYIDWSTFFHQSPNMFLTKNLTREEVSRIIEEVARLFEEHNRRKRRELLLRDPSYALRRLIKGRYYKPSDLYGIFRRWIWK